MNVKSVNAVYFGYNNQLKDRYNNESSDSQVEKPSLGKHPFDSFPLNHTANFSIVHNKPRFGQNWYTSLLRAKGILADSIARTPSGEETKINFIFDTEGDIDIVNKGVDLIQSFTKKLQESGEKIKVYRIYFQDIKGREGLAFHHEDGMVLQPGKVKDKTVNDLYQEMKNNELIISNKKHPNIDPHGPRNNDFSQPENWYTSLLRAKGILADSIARTPSGEETKINFIFDTEGDIDIVNKGVDLIQSFTKKLQESGEKIKVYRIYFQDIKGREGLAFHHEDGMVLQPGKVKDKTVNDLYQEMKNNELIISSKKHPNIDPHNLTSNDVSPPEKRKKL